MTFSRRQALVGAAAAGVTLASPRAIWPEPGSTDEPPVTERFDPWIEVVSPALEHNVSVTARMAGGRPILAVVKNNGYGLGLAQVGKVFDRLSAIAGLAVVRASEAAVLRKAGVTKPILVMARTTEDEAVELVRRDISIALFDDRAAEWCRRIAGRAGRRVKGQLYVDSGMSRMGIPVARAPQLLETIARERVTIEGAFTELTEDPDFDREQVARLAALADSAKARGGSLGKLHAASSAGVDHQPDTLLDLVRPGFMLYGGLVSQGARERRELRAAVRLRARVVRVERLDVGAGVSYHRRWKASRPTWVATLPLGHVDGYPSGATKGCEVLIGGRLYPVIGTVSASHTVIALGDEPMARVGDVATVMGPDHPSIHPDVVASRSEYCEYGVLFHLSPTLPRVVVSR
jgi:alanine racemase